MDIMFNVKNKRKIMIQVQLNCYIKSQLSPDMMSWTYNFDWFFYNFDSSEYVTRFLLQIDLFPMKNMTSKRKETASTWKIAINLQYSAPALWQIHCTKTSAAKYNPFKTCIRYKTFQPLKIDKSTATCVVTVKISLGNILSHYHKNKALLKMNYV